ncbi:glycine oxidase [Rhodococcus sp. SMB37]|uniref:glycine oxidase ThiO n=1 Tax=Rhodococcus sp. SMB37 TaxID=2512213 RepID=UPI0010EDC84B|nr:glycine oxidase ThiO [Rhodococcus sp. SMB37]TCN54325.1 glycine oxidase [Rhodococcus sp. SMB37]
MSTVAVIGGGVIGLSVAWRAARAGWTATVHDPDPGSGASWVAGGMLAPLSEGWPGEEHVLGLGAASLQRWPEFAHALERETGIDVFTAGASLTVALDAADAADLRTIASWVGEQGYEMRILTRAEIRDLEPSLGPRIRLGLLAPTELSVDNRRLVEALQRAAVAAGVQFVHTSVGDLDALREDRVVLAAGSASATLWPGLPVRPVKGEILRLRVRPGATPPPQHTVRGSVHGRPAYLVPRADGLVVGATQYEAGDTEVTVAGVRDLIADAEMLFPAIGEYELHEASAGLRPMTPDNLPLIGRLSDRVIAATGHGRNGILLTALTADAVLAELAGAPLPEATHADPRRFVKESVR